VGSQVSIQGTFDGNYVENQEGGGGGVYIERVDTEVFVNAEFMYVRTEGRPAGDLEGWAKGGGKSVSLSTPSFVWKAGGGRWR
jgi:hypothetical protein